MKLWKRVKYKKFDSGKDPYIAQQDNTTIPKPSIMEPVERTFSGRKYSELTPEERLNVHSGKTEYGVPLESGLEIVSPEFDILSGLIGIGSTLLNKSTKAAKAFSKASRNLKPVPTSVLQPKVKEIFYHGSPVNFDKFDTAFIGSGEGGSKAMKGINLWQSGDMRNAPKFANIRSTDAPIHLGSPSKPIGGTLDPTVYTVEGNNLNLFNTKKIKGLNQEDLMLSGYDGIRTPTQVTVFPNSTEKLGIIRKNNIKDFVQSNKAIQNWNPWSTNSSEMESIIQGNTAKFINYNSGKVPASKVRKGIKKKSKPY